MRTGALAIIQYSPSDSTDVQFGLHLYNLDGALDGRLYILTVVRLLMLNIEGL